MSFESFPRSSGERIKENKIARNERYIKQFEKFDTDTNRDKYGRMVNFLEARSKIEKNGADNLEEYLKAYTETILPSKYGDEELIGEELKGKLEKLKGDFLLKSYAKDRGDPCAYDVFYINKQGEIARAELSLDKIKGFREKIEQMTNLTDYQKEQLITSTLKQQLYELGFIDQNQRERKMSDVLEAEERNETWREIQMKINDYYDKLNKEAEQTQEKRIRAPELPIR